MIGPSPTYVPNDYNDIQAVLYSRGGYPQPPSGGAPSASISASYFPPPPAVAGNVYGSPPYASQAYDQRYASPEQQAPGAARHSVSPRTGYEGWKDATDSTYSGLPNAATTTSMDSMTGAFPSANDGQYGMNLSQLTQASPNGSAASTYHAIQSHQQPSPFGQSVDHFSSPPLVPDNSSFSIHTSPPPNQQTTSPDSTYYSSPTQIYDNGGARGSISQQPILFSSPDQKPIARYVPPQPAPPEGRRIAGNQRVQQRMNSISTNAISGSQSDIGPNSAGGLRPSLGGGSGFSSRSAGSAGSANYSLPISNPYLANNGQTSLGGSAQQSGASSTPKSLARPTAATSNPKKRPRHSHTDSLSVPGWQPQRSSANQLPPQSGHQPVTAGDLAAAFPNVHFDPAILGPYDGNDSSSSDDSEEEEDGGRAQASSGRGGRGGKGGKAGKAGRKNAIPPGMARL
ncbi:hypothetical protein FRC00_003825 [Tulasnella sp. 408]|nr:hypothetical protein FRC00_003825 [Tulasnella sp. 408]